MKVIDDAIGIQLKLIENKISKKDFQILCEFNLYDNQEDLLICINKVKKLKGVYLFEIFKDKSILFDDWIDEFTEKFRGFDNKYLQQWTPNIVEIRTNKHIRKPQTENEWVPLYIGKARNISTRLNQHINSTIGKPPSALKLKERGNLNDERFRIKYIDLDYIDNYDAIVAEVEKILRNKINPISGK